MPISKQRLELIKTILDDETVATEEDQVLHQLLHQNVSKNPIAQDENQLSVGQNASDKLAKFAGSWKFIIIFFVILTAWITLNAVILSKPYDVYPFILLNLVLSCLAAIQAPVILMSQNRQEQKDRLSAINDYKVNLKSEIIIETLYERVDTIINCQQEIIERLNALGK